MAESGTSLHLMAVDCCEHQLDALRGVPTARLTAIVSPRSESAEPDECEEEVDLVVIGLAQYPVRRVFISQLRRIYPTIPMLILRREEATGANEPAVRGEFVLSDRRQGGDCEVVTALREVLPLKPCEHAHKRRHYDLVRDVIRLIVEHYPDPELSLEQVARELNLTSGQLSRILNRQVGVSFRGLLRHTRIEEAKRMLASRRYSIKEVAARVGFADSHYFSRSFKQLTGLSASEYRAQDAVI